jgi:DNA ligase (NAD+)
LYTEEDVAVRCVAGFSCPGQKVERIKHFCSRKAMNIEGMGAKLILSLVENNLISNLSDVYLIDYDAVKLLPGMGDKSVENIKKAIDKSKSTSLSKFIYALGIREVGESTALSLARAVKKIDQLFFLTKDQLLAIPDVGPVATLAILDFFSNINNQLLIEKMLSLGLHVEPLGAQKDYKPLLSKKIVVTGSLDRFTRNEVKDLLLGLGAVIVSGVSPKTNYVLAGEKAGSKLDRAHLLGIEVVDEAWLVAIIKDPKD